MCRWCASFRDGRLPSQRKTFLAPACILSSPTFASAIGTMDVFLYVKTKNPWQSSRGDLELLEPPQASLKMLLLPWHQGASVASTAGGGTSLRSAQNSGRIEIEEAYTDLALKYCSTCSNFSANNRIKVFLTKRSHWKQRSPFSILKSCCGWWRVGGRGFGHANRVAMSLQGRLVVSAENK